MYDIDLSFVVLTYTSKTPNSKHHSGDPTALAVSSDTKWIASGFQDGSVLLIDVTKSRTSRVQRATSNPIRALAFSHKGPLRLACAHSDDKITGWDVSKMDDAAVGLQHLGYPPQRRSAMYDGHILALAWSPNDDRVMVCCERGHLFGWYPIANGGQSVKWLGQEDESTFLITFAAFSPDSHLLAYRGADGLCRIWSFERGALQATLNEDASSANFGVQFSASPGSRIVTWRGDAYARTWDATSGRALAVTGMHSAPVQGASFSSSGKLLTVLCDGSVVVWEQESDAGFTGSRILPRHSTATGTVNSACFSPGGTFIACAASDGTVCLWKADDVVRIPRVLRVHEEATLVAFMGNAVLVFVMKDGSVHTAPTSGDGLGDRVRSVWRRSLSGLQSSMSRMRSV